MSILKELLKEMSITSSSSIAANPSGGSEIRRRDISSSARSEWIDTARKDSQNRREDHAKMAVDPKAKENLEAARKKIKKKKSLGHKVKRFLGLGEAIDLGDVSSRFKDMENGSTEEDTVTYGVEDDQGNLMKVTVKSEQSKEFEERLSQEIQKNLEFNSDVDKLPDTDSPSMAEVLFKLKDEFDIVDVEFPTIPKNTVYKAAGVDVRDEDQGIGSTDLDNDLGYEDDEFGGEGDEMGGDMGAGGDPMSGEGGDEFGLGDGESGTDGEEDFSDDESVEDFSADTGSTGGTEGLLQAVLKMLQSDAEAKKAQAEAEAEKARALQAEYSAKAASASIAQQTELLAMEEEVAKQKMKEKEARKLADLAKFQVKKSNSFATESTEVALDKILVEFEVTDNPQVIMAARRQLNMQYKILPTDDDATKKYKSTARRMAMQELMARMRGVRAKQTLDAEKMQQQQDVEDKEQELNQNQNQQQNPNQQQKQRTRSDVAPAPSSVGSGRLGSMR